MQPAISPTQIYAPYQSTKSCLKESKASMKRGWTSHLSNCTTRIQVSVTVCNFVRSCVRVWLRAYAYMCVYTCKCLRYMRVCMYIIRMCLPRCLYIYRCACMCLMSTSKSVKKMSFSNSVVQMLMHMLLCMQMQMHDMFACT